MHLQNLQLIQFKNYEQAKFEFVDGINCLLGRNGVGKTNLLDAIYYLAFTKSAFNAVDKDNIQHDSQFFSIKAAIIDQDHKVEILCAVQQGEKKQLKWGGKAYEKLSDHIGKVPLVMIIPQDTDLIRDASEVRRKFFDSLLSQIDSHYLQKLMQYNHLLKQRNSLLKQLNEQNNYDASRIEPFDELMAPLAIELAGVRTKRIAQLKEVFIPFYRDLSGGTETVDIQYETNVGEDFKELLKARKQTDFYQARSTAGIHRDDYKFLIDGYPIKKFGSQGQQKSFLIAMKLSQFVTIEKEKNKKPILLLDDIFDKLDDRRIAYLLKMVSDGSFGQIFITDARPERTKSYLEALTNNKKYFNLDQDA
jgi:DNA replication and repair protein RecF